MTIDLNFIDEKNCDWIISLEFECVVQQSFFLITKKLDKLVLKSNCNVDGNVYYCQTTNVIDFCDYGEHKIIMQL